MNLAEIRQQYPQYNGVSDEKLATALHQKNYSHVPFEQFASAIGYTPAPKEVYDPSEGMSNLEAFNVAMGRGATQMVQGVKQRYLEWTNPEKAEAYKGEIAEDEREMSYLRNRFPKASFTGELAGNAVAAVPAAMAAGPSLPAQVAVGAGSGYALPTEGGQNPYTNAAIGGAVGLAVPMLGGVAAKVSAPLVNKLKNVLGRTALTQGGKLTRDGSMALESVGIDITQISDDVLARLSNVVDGQQAIPPGLSPQQQLRMADVQSVGANPTKGQVTRNFDDMQRESELGKINEVGAPLRARAEQNNTALIEYSQDLSRRMGGQGDTPYTSGQSIVDAVVGRQAQAKSVVDSAYNRARTTAGRGTVMDKDSFVDDLTETYDAFEDVLPSPIKNRIDQISKGERVFTVDEAEKLLKLVNTRYASADRQTRAALDGVRRSINKAEDTLGDGAGDAAVAYQAARKTASQSYKEFEPKPIAQIVDGKIVQDDLIEKTVATKGYKAKDLADMKKFFTEGPKDPASLQAWDEMRSQTIVLALKKATASARRNQAGDPIFSGAAFKKALDQIGMPKLKVLFNDKELAQLGTLTRAGEALTMPVEGAVNHSGTSAALINGIVDMIPVLGKVAKGGRLLSKVGGQSDEVAKALDASGGVNAETAQKTLESTQKLMEYLTKYSTPVAAMQTSGALTAPR